MIKYYFKYNNLYNTKVLYKIKYYNDNNNSNKNNILNNSNNGNYDWSIWPIPTQAPPFPNLPSWNNFVNNTWTVEPNNDPSKFQTLNTIYSPNMNSKYSLCDCNDCTKLPEKNIYGVCTSTYTNFPFKGKKKYDNTPVESEFIWFKNKCIVDNCTPPYFFNWIIGTCFVQPSTTDNNNCRTFEIDSEIEINYIGSYQYNEEKKYFELEKTSSFNCDGKNQPWNPKQNSDDWCKNNNNNWMPCPLPSTAANWRQGFYPAGRIGVGPPAFAFIISVNKFKNVCWYALNQSDLDTAPSGINDITNENNTWGCNNSGEFDMIEPVCVSVKKKKPEDLGRINTGYTTAWTGSNLGQYGRCLFWSSGLYSGETGGGGWGNSTKCFPMDKDDDEPISRIFLCIIDRVGMRTYQIPSDNKIGNKYKYWNGIDVKKCDSILCPYPNIEPKTTNGDDDRTSFVANFCPTAGANSPDFLEINENDEKKNIYRFTTNKKIEIPADCVATSINMGEIWYPLNATMWDLVLDQETKFNSNNYKLYFIIWPQGKKNPTYQILDENPDCEEIILTHISAFERYQCVPYSRSTAGIDRGYNSNFFAEKMIFLGEKSLWGEKKIPYNLIAVDENNDKFNMKDKNNNISFWYESMESKPKQNKNFINRPLQSNLIQQNIISNPILNNYLSNNY